MSGRTESRRRLLALLVGLVVLAGSLMLRLSWWQIAQHDVFLAMERIEGYMMKMANRLPAG